MAATWLHPSFTGRLRHLTSGHADWLILPPPRQNLPSAIEYDAHPVYSVGYQDCNVGNLGSWKGKPCTYSPSLLNLSSFPSSKFLPFPPRLLSLAFLSLAFLSVTFSVASSGRMSRNVSRGRSGRRVLAHAIAGHPTQPDSVLYAPQRPWEDWTPQPPGTFHFHANGSRQSEITLEVSMRDIIENSKTSSDPFERRYSTDSTRTANDESEKTSDFGNEKGDKALPPPPIVPVGFWDDRLAKTRKEVLKGWLKIS